MTKHGFPTLLSDSESGTVVELVDARHAYRLRGDQAVAQRLVAEWLRERRAARPETPRRVLRRAFGVSARPRLLRG